MRGLNIKEDEFDNYTQSQKMTILFRNTEEIKKQFRGWRLQLKIQWWWLGGLTAGFLSLLGIKTNIV